MKAYSWRDARQLTKGSNDWRQAIWNRWLISYLTPREQSALAEPAEALASPKPHDESASSPAHPSTSPPPVAATPEFTKAAHFAQSEPPSSIAAPPDEGTTTTPPSTASRDEETRSSLPRANAVRARLDRVAEQINAVEVALDDLTERQSAGASYDRLERRRFADIVERLVETQERHTETLLACTRALERLERRVMWAERQSRLGHLGERLQAPFGEESEALETLVPRSGSQRIRRAPEQRSGSDPASPLNGKLSDISLPTLLSMSELERWTGRLTLQASGRTVIVDLESGLLVGVFEDDSPSDAVEALHELIDDRDGRFTFSPSPSVTRTELAPMTVGTLLLRASHRRDEMNRADFGT